MKYLVYHKDKIVGCLLMSISISVFSQKSESTDITNITRATFFSPCISYEARVGKFQSIVGNATLAASFYFSSSSTFGTSYELYFDPALGLQYRYYYNYEKRKTKGKRTDKNSLNYVTALAQAIFTKNRLSSSYLPEENIRPIYSIGPAWGFQRNYPKRFSLDLSLGLGYAFASSTTLDQFGRRVKTNSGIVTTIGSLSLGFWLNKRN